MKDPKTLTTWKLETHRDAVRARLPLRSSPRALGRIILQVIEKFGIKNDPDRFALFLESGRRTYLREEYFGIVDLRASDVEEDISGFWSEMEYVNGDCPLVLRLVDEKKEAALALARLKESMTSCIQLMQATEQAARAKEEGGMKSVILEAQLKGKAKALAALKKGVFTLHEALHNSVFAEEFIANDGLDTLKQIVATTKGSFRAKRKSTSSLNSKLTTFYRTHLSCAHSYLRGIGNTQAYALKAVYVVMTYANGLETVLGTPGLIQELFCLLDKSSSISVNRTACELLFVACDLASEYGRDGYEVLSDAAKYVASASHIAPYSNVIELLSCGDLDTQINALTLLNVLLAKCPTRRKQARLLQRLDAAGMLRTLSELSEIGIHDVTWNRQVSRAKARAREEIEAHRDIVRTRPSLRSSPRA